MGSFRYVVFASCLGAQHARGDFMRSHCFSSARTMLVSHVIGLMD